MSRFVVSSALLALSIAAASAAAQNKRPMTFLDMQQMRAVGAGNLSADGKQLVYALITPDWKTAASQSDLYVVSTERGLPSTRQLTFTRDKIETQPRWAPDGSWLVFVSNRDGGNHLYAMRPDSSEPRRITTGSSGVTTFEFSPDAQWLVYRSGPADAEQLYALAVADIAAAREAKPRQITAHPTGVDQWQFSPDTKRIYYVAPDAIDRLERERLEQRFTVQVRNPVTSPSSLWAIAIDGGKAIRLTGDTTQSVDAFTVSPDGRWIGYRSTPNDRYKRNGTPEQQFYGNLFLLETSSGRIEQLTNTVDAYESPISFSPDSRLIAFTGSDDRRGFNISNLRVYVRPVDDSKAEWRKLGAGYDGDVVVRFWSPDSRTIYFDDGVRATTQLFSLDVASGRTKQLTDVKGTVVAQLAKNGRSALLLYQEPSTPPIAYVVQGMEQVADRSKWIQVADPNPQLASIALGETEEITWRSKDGVSVGGVLVKPVGYAAGRRYPLAVVLHGGPHAAELLTFNGDDIDGPQVYAGAGWMVFIPNYRGSTGYGEKFKTQIVGNYLDLSYRDVMAGVDHLIARGMVDSTKMGVMGHSAGGTLGAWILTHTNRFKAISSGAGVSNWISMWAQSDIQRARVQALGGKPWYKDFDNWWNQSPLKYVANAKTPTLIYSTQGDIRVPSSQAIDLYSALRDLGVPTELYLYPGTQHGTPGTRNRMAHGMAEMAWMEYWVRGSGKPFSWTGVLATLADSTPVAPNVLPVAVTDVVMRTYVGEYELAPGRTVVVTFENGSLFAQATGRGKDQLIPESTTEFAVRAIGSGLRLRFAADGSGVVLSQNGAERAAKRLTK